VDRKGAHSVRAARREKTSPDEKPLNGSSRKTKPEHYEPPSSGEGCARFKEDKPARNGKSLSEPEGIWRKAWKATFPDAVCSPWTKKQLAQVKHLVDGGYSTHQVGLLLKNLVRDWAKWKKKFDLDGQPSVGVLVGYINRIAPEVLRTGDAARIDMSRISNPRARKALEDALARKEAAVA